MPDPSIVRFRRVVSSAYANLEARRQEVNDLNVFPVADGDTGDNMAMTMRAVMEELDRLDGMEVDEVGRTQLVQALARAALMGARGNSGVILSQIVRGAAEELASRPGELIDPVLVASAFASAADAAYDSVRDPAEGTMLTVFREMAHSIARQLAHLDAGKQRLEQGVADETQDAVLAEILERAIEDGQRAVERTPEQLEVLRESGVVDAGGYGLVLILAGVVAGLRGDEDAVPEIDHHEAPKLSQPHHEDSRFRYCTNFIVSGSGLSSRDFLPRLEGLGDSVLVVGDEATLKVHVHTDTPEAAVALFEDEGEVTNLDVADMREQIAERRARLEGGRSGALAVAAGEGLERLFAELGAHVVPGGETLNPSTYELLAGIHQVPAYEVLVLPSSSNVIMAAERACELSEKPARVVSATSQQASLLALVELDPEATLAENAERLEAALATVAAGGVAPAARDDAQGRFRKGDAVGFVGEEIVAWGGAGTTLASTIEKLAEGAEIVTVIGGAGCPDRARGARPARARGGRGRDPRRRSAELVVAARRPVVRVVRRRRGADPAQLREAPVHWPRPSVLDVSLQALEGVGPKTGRGRGARPASPPSATCCCASRTGHRDRTVVSGCRRWSSGRQATIAVEVLANAGTPLPSPRPQHPHRQGRRRHGHRPGHLVQPTLAGSETDRRRPPPAHRLAGQTRLPRSPNMSSSRVARACRRGRAALRAVHGLSSDPPPCATRGRHLDDPVHPATEELKPSGSAVDGAGGAIGRQRPRAVAGRAAGEA